MKESIGGISLFMLVIMLIVIFTGIMSYTVNRSNAFAIKDEIVSLLEKESGFDMKATYDYDNNKGDKVLGSMVDIIGTHKYRQTGPCPKKSDFGGKTEVACYDRVGKTVYDGEDASIIILKHKGNKDTAYGTTEPYYYEVWVYYRFDLPILNNILIFKISGQTKPIY